MIRRRYSGEILPFDANNYMTIEAIDDVVVYFELSSVEYSKDGKVWRFLPACMEVALAKGELCFFRRYTQKGDYIGYCKVSGRFNLKGNCLSLVFGDEAKINNSLAGYITVFSSMFLGAKVVNVESSFLPAVVLEEGCYLAMFNGCKSLVNAPELPATTLGIDCYHSMFYGCTSLVNAPELPATALADRCYMYMFYGCINLNYIKMLATNISATGCLDYWVDGVSSTGTFVKSKDATWDVVGASGIPEGWTVETE